MTVHFAEFSFSRPRVPATGLAGTADRLRRIGLRAWAMLAEVGQARARSELNRIAVRFDHDPALAQALRGALPANPNR